MRSFPYLTDMTNAIFGTEWTLPIPTFGILVATAIIVATQIARREVRRQELTGRLPDATHSNVIDLAVITAVAGFLGARIFHILDYPSEFLADPVSMIFSRGGFSIYGGLVFGVVAGLLFLKQRGIPILPMLDAVAPSMMIGYAIGRIGCQVAGDGDWGIEANMALKPGWLPDWLWAQTYEGNILGVVIPPPGVYPTPIYETLAALVLFAVLLLFRSHRHGAGFLFSLYLILAGFQRLLIEKIRVNTQHEAFGIYFTQAELVSVLVILAGFVGVLLTLRARSIWSRALFAVGVLAALSACVPM